MKHLTTILILLFGFQSLNAQENRSLNFDGTDDFISLGNISSEDEFTVTAVFKPDYDNILFNNAYVFRWGTNPGFGIALDFINQGNLIIEDDLNNGGGSFPLGLSGWNRIDYVGTTNSRKVYINKVLILEYNSTFNDHSGTFLIGKKDATTIPPTVFAGEIDEVRIWSVAKSLSDINLNYFCPLTGEEEGLIAYYNFDQGVINGNNTNEDVLIDRTGNGNDGTLANFGLSGNESNWTQGAPSLFYPNTELMIDNTTITSDVSELVSYQWLDCNDSAAPITGATESSYSPTAMGSYALEIIDNNNSCTTTTECVEFGTSNLSDVNELLTIHIYPNPATDILILQSDFREEIEIRIYDALAREILFLNSSESEIKIDLSEFPTGIYSLIANDENRTAVSQFAKQ